MTVSQFWMTLSQRVQLVVSTQLMPVLFKTHSVRRKGYDSGYLDGHQNLLLVGWQVVALSQEDFSKGSLSELPLQHDVVSLYVLNNCWNKIQTKHRRVTQGESEARKIQLVLRRGGKKSLIFFLLVPSVFRIRFNNNSSRRWRLELPAKQKRSLMNCGTFKMT